MDVVGIFRLSGDYQQITTLLKAYDNGTLFLIHKLN